MKIYLYQYCSLSLWWKHLLIRRKLTKFPVKNNENETERKLRKLAGQLSCDLSHSGVCYRIINGSFFTLLRLFSLPCMGVDVIDLFKLLCLLIWKWILQKKHTETMSRDALLFKIFHFHFWWLYFLTKRTQIVSGWDVFNRGNHVLLA